MRAKAVALLLALLLVAAACGDDDGTDAVASGPGLILCSEVGELGEGLEGLLVVTPEGERVRSIPGGVLTPLWLPANSSKALYRDLESGAVLVDAAGGRTTPIGGGLMATSPWYSTQHFLVAQRTPLGGVLIDFDRGTSYDLADLLGFADPGDVIPYADFDVAEDQVLIVNLGRESGAWLVPTGAPREARRIADAEYSASLRDDGQMIVFVADGTGYLGPAGGTDFAPFGAGLIGAVWVQDGILAVGRGTVYRYDANGSDERLLYEAAGASIASRLTVDHSGRWAMLAITPEAADSDPVWLVLDGRKAAATELGLAGQMTVLAAGDGRMLLGSRSDGFTGVGGFDEYRVVDLAAASVTELLVPADGLNPGVPSPDGNHHLLYGRDGWFLVDLAAVTIAPLPGDPQGASFSPDGRRIVMAPWDGEDRASVDLVVAEVADVTAGTPLGVTCRNPLWVAGG